jgi:hypothetical protein
MKSNYPDIYKNCHNNNLLATAGSPGLLALAIFLKKIGKYHRYQNKVLKCIVNAPWYARNNDLHRNLGIETVTDIIAKFTKSHE